MKARPRLILYTAQLSATGGGQHALARLAVAVGQSGRSVVLFTEPPFNPHHRYVRWLETAGLAVEVLPGHKEGPLCRVLRLLVQWSAALPWALFRGRSPREAWRSLGNIGDTLLTRWRYHRIRARLSAAAADGAALLHVWGPSALTPELLGWARDHGIPAIYHEMGEGDAAYVRTWGLSRTVETVNHAACVICCSTSIARNIEAVYGFSGPIHTVAFPIDDPPSPLPTRPAGGRVVFGAIGRLVPHKRHSELIQAVHLLHDEGCPVGLLIAGDGPMRPDLERLTRQLGLSAHVRFTGEFEDLAGVMAQFDVFALTSASESQCMPITESMAYGKAVIASRFGGIPDFVEHEVTGLLVELGDIGGLVAAMRRLAADPELRRRMGEAGRARYLERYTESGLVARYEAIYADLNEPASGAGSGAAASPGSPGRPSR